MKGSLILEKVMDPKLRREWDGRLADLSAALRHLYQVKQASGEELSQMTYLEAVARFAEARDNERNFFWDTFVEERMAGPKPER